MQWWQAFILGTVEGLTEYLPVSSTGHLILVTSLLGLNETAAQRRAMFTFNIVIQAGAIAAVLGLYWPRVRQMVRGMLGRDPAGRTLTFHLLLAFLPAAICGLLLGDSIEEFLNGPWPVVAALMIGGFVMIVTAENRESVKQGAPAAGLRIEQISWRIALLIGCGQCVAMCPGTSRSMMTIVTALLLGMAAVDAAEFSFLLGLLTLSAATVYQGWKGGREMLTQIAPLELGVGFVAAAISAALAIGWFVRFLNRYGVGPFGWYRLGLALVISLLLRFGWMH